jgi:hypothetical protein
MQELTPTEARERRVVRVGWLAVIAGTALAVAVQVAAPVGVPLYDGVSIVEPYRFLHPAGSQSGSPTSFSTSYIVQDGVSPTIVAATTEIPAQVQLVAQEGAFEVPAGVAALQVTITPVEPPDEGPQGSIAGNVYRVRVTDPAGNDVALAPCDACRTLVMRSPENVTTGSIQRYANGTWTPTVTLHAGLASMYQTNAEALGDFAVVAGGAGVDTALILLGGGIVLILLAFVGLLVVRGRPTPSSATKPGRMGAGRGAIPSRVPSKRKRGRRPPSGRSGQ